MKTTTGMQRKSRRASSKISALKEILPLISTPETPSIWVAIMDRVSSVYGWTRQEVDGVHANYRRALKHYLQMTRSIIATQIEGVSGVEIKGKITFRADI